MNLNKTQEEEISDILEVRNRVEEMKILLSSSEHMMNTMLMFSEIMTKNFSDVFKDKERSKELIIKEFALNCIMTGFALNDVSDYSFDDILEAEKNNSILH